jgi:hypothetical protein
MQSVPSIDLHVYDDAVLNPLNAKLNPICHLLALLAHHILHVSRVKVKAESINRPAVE